ncbi:LacI family DNA-binding transcriptional regulator [Streptococcus macedonicus]|nr:LacI family DNA-binding transcriptional regulator [Streptococcus macedonicus]
MATLKDIAKLAKVSSATVSELHSKKLDNKSNFLECFSMKLSYEDKIERLGSRCSLSPTRNGTSFLRG